MFLQTTEISSSSSLLAVWHRFVWCCELAGDCPKRYITRPLATLLSLLYEILIFFSLRLLFHFFFFFLFLGWRCCCWRDITLIYGLSVARVRDAKVQPCMVTMPPLAQFHPLCVPTLSTRHDLTTQRTPSLPPLFFSNLSASSRVSRQVTQETKARVFSSRWRRRARHKSGREAREETARHTWCYFQALLYFFDAAAGLVCAGNIISSRRWRETMM